MRRVLLNEIPKVVFSKTMTKADWTGSRIASGDLKGLTQECSPVPKNRCGDSPVTAAELADEVGLVEVAGLGG